MKKKILTICLILSISLVAASSILSWNSFTYYESTILEEQDSQLYEKADSIDLNLKTICSSLETSASITIIKSETNKELQNTANYTENYSALKKRIRKSALNKNDLVLKIICRKGKKVLFVTDGSEGYSFPKDAGKDKLRICEDKEENSYLAYECKSGKYTYDILLNLEELYGRILSEEEGNESRLILLNSDSDIAIYKTKDGVFVCKADEVSESKEYEIDFIEECEENNKSEGISFEKFFNEGDVSATARMVSVPTGKTRNSNFAIGIITNFDASMAPLRKAIRKMTWCMLLAAFGMTILVVCIILIRRQTAVKDAELKELQEKNEAMTELNQQMQALTHHQRLETIGTMTSSIAHEFNNLLTPIMAYSMMALDELPEGTETYENLIEVYDSSRKAKEMIERLSEISRKGNSIIFKSVNINRSAEKAVTTTNPIHREDVKIILNKSTEEIYVSGDETQLQQLLMNLILNAHHAIEGVGTITVSTSVKEENAIIEVEDTGMGISPSGLAHIFDPFYTTKESGKGTGLGLAIAARIVENHKGKIYVESKVGKGTKFTISLPLEKAALGEQEN